MVARGEQSGGSKKEVKEIKRLRKLFQEFALQNNSIYFACNIEIFFQYKTFQCNHLDMLFQIQTLLLGARTSHSILGIIQSEKNGTILARAKDLVPSLHGKWMGKQWKQCQTLSFWAPKSLQMVIAAMKLKDAYSLEGKL